MKFSEIYSSVVFVGEGFSSYMFKPDSHQELLGNLDVNLSVITPIVSHFVFSGSGYRVTITPERFDLAYTKSDILPEGLNSLAKVVADVIARVEAPVCTGVGINLNLTIDLDGEVTGLDFCRQKFMVLPDIGDQLHADRFLANTAKLIFEKDDVRYAVDVEPNFATNGRALTVKINGHQDVSPNGKKLPEALSVFDGVKKYMSELPALLIKE